MKKREPFKRDRSNADPRRRGFLVWKGRFWAFPQSKKLHLAWKPKTRVGWRLDYYQLRKAGL